MMQQPTTHTVSDPMNLASFARQFQLIGIIEEFHMRDVTDEERATAAAIRAQYATKAARRAAVRALCG